MPKRSDFTHFIILALSTLLYARLFYYTQRYQSVELSLLFILLFAAYVFLLARYRQLNIGVLLGAALLYRLLPLLALPALSDDFYRFIWDGRLWAAGINPFAGLPADLVDNPALRVFGITPQLFGLLNSPTHYTVYPAIPQFINWLAAKLFPHDILHAVLVMRLFIIMAEATSLWLIVRILRKASQPVQLVSIYALNPLVIIELSGNLHHEALMLVFLLAFIYAWQQNKINIAGFWLALSVAAKLLPLMFLPFILLKLKQRGAFLAVFLATLLLVSLPLLDASFWAGMADSLTLYYQKLEFNAGLYYLLRQIGYWLYGYNTIAFVGKLLFVVGAGVILILSYMLNKRAAGLAVAFTLIYTIYAFTSPILHPWYVILPVALAPFTRWRFPLVWSLVICFTYLGYSQTGFTENYLVVTLEYLAVLVAMYYDYRDYALSKRTLNAAP